jgi:hypothetical protein
MPRTILIADPDDTSRERIARIAYESGYRVLKAQTPAETAGALDACPITAVVIAEELLRRCDLRRLLLRAQVVVLSKERREPLSQDVALVPKDASPAELTSTLVSVTGGPHFPGPRVIVPLPSIAADANK